MGEKKLMMMKHGLAVRPVGQKKRMKKKHGSGTYGAAVAVVGLGTWGEVETRPF